jgi:hypothetical protein
MIPMQDLVERVLSHSTADGGVVVGSEHTETNLRWAANNLDQRPNGVAVGHSHLSSTEQPDRARRGYPLR